jgi:class 3 adenylate cyclase
MTEAKDARLVASVVFVEMLEYMKKSVAEQIRVTERFHALLSAAVQGVAAADRIVLDTGNGAAVSFLGAPQDALRVAIKLRDGIAAEPQIEPRLLVRIGVNSGPVRLIKNTAGEPNIIGDGVNVAQSMMGFAEPGQIMASRAYYDAVAGLSKDVAESFTLEGSRTDRDLREHQVYLVRPLRGSRGADTGANGGPANVSDTQAVMANRNKKLRLAALGAVAGILVLAIGVRSFRTKPPEVVTLAPPAAVTAAPEPAPAPAAQPEAAPAKAVPKSKAPPKPKAAPAAAAPTPAVPAASTPAAAKPAAPQALGSIEFAITPWGEVHVDGSKRGISPPLTEVQVAPGKHTIEIRNTAFPSYTTSVDVAAGAQAKIKYKFN